MPTERFKSISVTVTALFLSFVRTSSQLPDYNECSAVIIRDEFTSLGGRWSKDEPDPSKSEISISSGELDFIVNTGVDMWVSGRNDVPILWIDAPTGEYWARTSVTLQSSASYRIAGLTVFDTDGALVDFHHSAHYWSSSADGACFQPIGSSQVCNTVNLASNSALTIEMHSLGTGVFNFYVWTDSSTRVTVKSSYNNGATRSRIGLILKTNGAASAKYDWFELELPAATHNCHTDATCTDTVGSFTCACNSGFSGDGVSSCSPAVSCDEVNDSPPNTITAQVIRTDSGQAGTTTQTATFTYSCNNGYQLVGSGTPTFTCTGTAYQTSEWQGGTVPMCTAVSCDEVNDSSPNTLSAQVTRTDSGQTGTMTQTAVFTYSCNNGYQLVGSGTPTFTCTGTAYASSEWQGGTVPTCTAVSCDETTDSQPNPLSAQVIRTDSGQSGTTTQTATFTYSCNNGYQLVGSGTPTFTCTGTAYASSEWQGGTVPTCTAVSCDETTDTQPNTLTAQVIRTDSGQSGTTTQTATFTYSCNNGYQLVGSGTPIFTCTGTAYQTSEWQGTVPTCTAVSCDETTDTQPNTLSAEVIRTDSGQSGTTTQTAMFTYSCKNGYQLVGSGTPTFTCTGTAYQTSEWQGGTVPTCTAVPCDETSDPQPNTPGANAVRSDGGGQSRSTTDTGVFNYTCNTGFVFSGSSEALFTCTGDALGTSSWKGTPPDCFNFNECSNQTHNCVPDFATCTDTEGSFECSCNEGFQGDGVQECACESVRVICEPDGSTPAAEVTSNYDTEMAVIQQWQAENTGVPGTADLAASSLAVLDEKLSECLAVASPAEKEQIAKDSASSAVETISNLLDAMDSEALAGTGSASGGDSSSSSDGGGSGSGTTLGGVVVVTAPAAEKPSQADAEVATAAAVKILQAVDNIADNLAEAVPVGEVTVIKTETLSIAVQSSPPDATTVEAKSETASIQLELADTTTIASLPQTGAYEGIVRTIRQSLPSNARSDKSDKARRLTLMESVSNPAPFAGARTRENGFVTAGLSPFIRMAARQGGEVIGGSRTALMSSGTSSARAAGGRSSRRLADDASDSTANSFASVDTQGAEREDTEKTFEKETSEGVRELAEVSFGKNIATVELSSPEQNNLVAQRELIEREWDVYRLGRTGGVWVVECAQLDVQNEEWTHDGCAITGADGGEITEQQIVCTCEIRAMEAVFSISQRYVEPPASAPTSGTAQQTVLEDLPRVGYVFLLQTVSVSSFFIFLVLAILLQTAFMAERKLLPILPEVSPSLSMCTWRRRHNRTGLQSQKVAALKDIQASSGHTRSDKTKEKKRGSVATDQEARAGRYHSQASQSGKGKEKVKQQAVPEGSEATSKASLALQEVTARAKALFGSEGHVQRIRKFFNPRRIVAFHLSRGVCFDESGRVVSEPPSAGRCRCSCLRRAFVRQTSLGVCDARVIRQALKARRAQSVEERKEYELDQRERQKALWKQMEVEMAGRQYEMGFVFSTEEIRARVLRAMAERKGKKGKGKGKKAGDGDSSSSSSSDFDSDSSSSGSSGSGSEAGKEESDAEESVGVSESAELYEDLAALLEALEGADKRDSLAWREQEKELREKLQTLKKKADLILDEASSDEGSHSAPAYGRGATGEVVLLVPSQSKEAESEAEGKEGGRGSESRRRISVTDGTVRLVKGGGACLSPSGSFGTFLSLQSPSPLSHKTFFGGNTRKEEEEKEDSESSSVGSLSDESMTGTDLVEEQPTRNERGLSGEGKEDSNNTAPLPAMEPESRTSEWSSSSLSVDSYNLSSDPCASSASPSSSGAEREKGEHTFKREGTQKKETETEEEKKVSKKQKTKSLKRLKSTAAEVHRRLSACGLGAPAKRWRAPMAIVAPADASRDGTLPLRARFCLMSAPLLCWMSIKRNIIAVRVSQAKLVAHISDLSILTETLVFSCKMLLTLNVAFFLCLTAVFIGETDDRHTNRKPVTIVNAPRGFGLEGFGDMEAFLNASALKALVAYLCVEVLFALSVCPLLGSIWSAENSFGRLDPQRLIWSSRGKGKTEGGEEKNANVGIDEEGERGERQEKESENDEEKEEKEGEKEEEQIVSRGPWGLSYFDFPPGLSRETRKAKVPRMESARLYIRARRQEVVAQYVLAGAAVTFLLLLLLLFTVVGLAGEWFPLRHKQFVLREYLLSSLLVFCFALGFPFFLGIAEGIVVWHISPGMDVVKSLDGTPTADWVVPAPAAVF
uniref:Sushi, von Willebrand factor type A, EGF and pentraxin domain-containing protein 1 n=1 Tax=Chromera velia CCMP2878 TaxID=1169474 RepID=A0A0G4F086_9ALVE|eukprot:Cvel_14359.t1-p1 / transcript=Cvel_14359.t1 / gene=Cvel_14359 / organism=Chromera_velia_CCMP2878 / gene_product=E-selectin, putative / transcript_product=E-selectin, putative / location=Cvel_scaffold1018:25381-43445(+) / protein_length=2230 / sequence_SO=supercontig / SO=protein_coding / is_pseudo=false